MKDVFRIFTILLSLLMMASGCASNPKPQQAGDLVISRTNGPPLKIGEDVQQASPVVKHMIDRIEEMDLRLERWRGEVSGNPEVIALMEAVALQNREDAIDELQKALVIASSTSGPLDFLFGDAEKKVDETLEVLGTDPPASVWCKTEITAVPENSFIHYMTEGDFIDGLEEWSSYTIGELLRIGRYRFRVSGTNIDYKERVLVIADPLVKQLQPTQIHNDPEHAQ